MQTQGNGTVQMDNFELIAMGKKLQEMAASAGLHCPQFSTAFGIRIAAKIIHIAVTGPRLTEDTRRQFMQDLKTVHMIAEGERAELYSKMITQIEKLTDMVRQKKDLTAMHGNPVFSDADIELMKWSENLLIHARKADPVKIQ